MNTEVETRICKVCGEELPIEKFQMNKPKDGKPYRIYTCNKCRYLQKIERLNKLTDRIEIILDRRYKPIKSERILDKGLISHIDLVAEDEIFVRLMDYKDVWISNYGRAIHLYADGEYKLIRQKLPSFPSHILYGCFSINSFLLFISICSCTYAKSIIPFLTAYCKTSLFAILSFLFIVNASLSF